MMNKKHLGDTGEEEAVSYLIRTGHEILERNYVYDRAEIDIISKHNNILVFTEVKTRTHTYYGYPEEAVTPQKEEQISKVALHYIEKHYIQSEIRFDIIAVVKTGSSFQVHHIKDAFFPIF